VLTSVRLRQHGWPPPRLAPVLCALAFRQVCPSQSALCWIFEEGYYNTDFMVVN